MKCFHMEERNKNLWDLLLLLMLVGLNNNFPWKWNEMLLEEFFPATILIFDFYALNVALREWRWTWLCINPMNWVTTVRWAHKLGLIDIEIKIKIWKIPLLPHFIAVAAMTCLSLNYPSSLWSINAISNTHPASADSWKRKLKNSQQQFMMKQHLYMSCIS